ncbi:MAG: efflux RND transporter permease subunit, partial [Pseudomonadota bacterium]
IIFVFALVVIYLVLAAQFESFRDPFIILVTVPMAAVGALIPINVFLSVNIYTQIGLITLIGLISKHGILMVDFANQLQREEGLSPHDAMVKSAGIRLRPILMTTAAIVFGVMPLLLADGAGAASRFHIGATIVGGMTIGTLFTLFILPIVYTLMASKPKPLKSADMALAEPAE